MENFECTVCNKVSTLDELKVESGYPAAETKITCDCGHSGFINKNEPHKGCYTNGFWLDCEELTICSGCSKINTVWQNGY